jgi:hypothetical protein
LKEKRKYISSFLPTYHQPLQGMVWTRQGNPSTLKSLRYDSKEQLKMMNDGNSDLC